MVLLYTEVYLFIHTWYSYILKCFYSYIRGTPIYWSVSIHTYMVILYTEVHLFIHTWYSYILKCIYSYIHGTPIY